MTTLREAAQQALEALEWHLEKGAWGADIEGVTAALRERLAQPEQEPVTWSGYDLDGMVEAFSRVIEAHYQRANPFQNPIDMDAQMALRILRGFIPAMKAYTAPPPRKPLTEEQIKACEQQAMVNGALPHEQRLLFARAIERAHGIV